jgi:hypothetical protein
LEDQQKQPITVAQLKEAGIDKLVAELTDAIDKEDDANVGKALQDLTEGLKKIDSPEDNPGNNGDGKPDPFADKVEKYAPQGK